MITDKIAVFIKSIGESKNGERRRIPAIIAGTVVFLVILPVIGILLGRYAGRYYTFDIVLLKKQIFSAACIISGLTLMLWATVTQWRTGKGTPNPSVPTKKLIISGAYKYSRNPIELSAIIYYLGIGTIFDTLMTGILCFTVYMIAGSAYHKFIEEKELEMRFGEEYLIYRSNTPFLIPWKLFKQN